LRRIDPPHVALVVAMVVLQNIANVDRVQTTAENPSPPSTAATQPSPLHALIGSIVLFPHASLDGGSHCDAPAFRLCFDG
jgi:hypothetical protein